MAELSKVRRVIARQLEGAPHETLLTIDATTGQNGLRQAQLFAAAAEVTGVVLTKLDGTARGGIALAIARELRLAREADRGGRVGRGPAPVRSRGLRARADRRGRNPEGMDVWIIVARRGMRAWRRGDAPGRLLPGAVRGRRGARGGREPARRGRAAQRGRVPRRFGDRVRTLRPVARRHRRLPPRSGPAPRRWSVSPRSCSSGSPTTRASAA